jgi:hypothetical protein
LLQRQWSPEQVAGWLKRYHGTANVIGKEYFVRQAAILFGMAKATTDPKISAALLDKAADLKSQLDEPIIDRSPRAPDVQPEK